MRINWLVNKEDMKENKPEMKLELNVEGIVTTTLLSASLILLSMVGLEEILAEALKPL